MTDLPNSAADPAANASTPDGETPAADEMAHASDAGPTAGDATREAGADATEPVFDVTSAAADSSSPDPDEPAPVAANADAAGTPTVAVAAADATTADAPARGDPADTTLADTSPASESGVDAVPVLPLVAAVTDGKPTAGPRRRRSLALRFGVSFVLGILLAAGIGAGGLYAWGRQYEGRVLPGVRVGSTELGGLSREQAEAEIGRASCRERVFITV